MMTSPRIDPDNESALLCLVPRRHPASLHSTAEYRLVVARETWELAGCVELRRQVFCEEQRIFSQHDRDSLDGSSNTLMLAAIACFAGMPDRVVGTVRVVNHGEQHWSGSRLAVCRSWRGQALIGSELIRHAVGLAQARGCARFTANVQRQNVPLFAALHWLPLADSIVQGRLHKTMLAQLEYYPVRPDAVAFTRRGDTQQGRLANGKLLLGKPLPPQVAA